MNKRLRNTAVLILLSLFCFSAKFSTAQTTLNPGDLAIIGINNNGPSANLAVVALKTIAPNTVIKFTDKGWLGATKALTTSGADGTITLTTIGITAGTAFTFTITGGATPTATVYPNVGTIAIDPGVWAGATLAGNAGDSWLIYTGAEATPNFIYGLANWATLNPLGAAPDSFGWVGSGTAANASVSYLPDALKTGDYHNNLAGPNFLIYSYYSGSFVGSKASILSSIKDRNNWTQSGQTPSDLRPGAGNVFPVTQPTFTLGSVPQTVTSNPSTGTKAFGEHIAISVTFSDVVTVTGFPRIKLAAGTEFAFANYVSGSGTEVITFDYVVGAGQFTSDLNYGSTTALELFGGTMKDPNNNDAVLTLPAVNSASSLGGSSSIVIDALPPSITSVNAFTANGSYREGANIFINVNFNEAVNITGIPVLALNTGVNASYNSGSGTSTIEFRYTVAAGQNTTDLDYVNSFALTLPGGATLKDLVGNSGAFILSPAGTPGSLGANAAIIIDTTTPTVASVSGTNGTYNIGTTVPISVVFSEPVAVTGTPTLALDAGSPAANVNYSSGTGTTTLTFNYTVAAGQSSADLDYTNTTALSLAGGTIKDAAGNVATLTLASPGLTNSLANTSDIVVNGVRPTIVSIVRESNAAELTKANEVRFTVTFSEGVSGVDLSDFSIKAGAPTGSGITTFTPPAIGGGLTATIIANTGTGDGILGFDLKASGTGITSVASGNAISGGFTTGQTYTVDKTAPTLSAVSIVSNNANPQIARAGNIVTLSFTASEALGSVSPTINGQSVNANSPVGLNYTVSYPVTAGTTEGRITFTLDGNDFAGNFATQVTSTSNSSKVIVDNVATTATSVNTTTPDGTYVIGDMIPITVTFNEPVVVTGMPIINLNSIGVANYTSGSGTTVLTFNYTVAANQVTSKLDYHINNPFRLNSGTIVDETGSAVSLTLPPQGGVGSLGNGRNIVINTTRPTVLGIVRTGAAPYLTNASTASFTLTFSEAVTGVDLADFNLNSTGPTATFASVTPVSPSVYTLIANTGTGNGIIGFQLKTLVSTGIVSILGNPVEITPYSNEVYEIDKTPPTLSTITIQSNHSGIPTIAIPGDIITLNFTASKIISTPIVTINGGTATVQNPSGNNWVATYTTLATDNNGVIPFNIAYTDKAGNVGTAGTSTSDASLVTFDKTAPTLTSVTIASNIVSYPAYAKVGSMLTLLFTTSEIVPTPTVTIGGVTPTVLPMGGLNWMAMYPVPPTLAEGQIPFTINFKDSFGNNGIQQSTVTTGSMVTLDKTVPTLSNVSIISNNPNTSLAKPGDQVKVTFTASEGIGTPTVSIDGMPATVTSLANNVWTATLALTTLNTTGLIPFGIQFSDYAGNAGLPVSSTNDASTVTFDKTAPTIPTSLVATAGDQENTLTWSLDNDVAKYELIGGTPISLGSGVLNTVLVADATNPMTFTQTGLTNLTTYYYALRVTDAAGNAITSLTTLGRPLPGQTITFSQPAPAEYGSSFTINATSTSGLPVTLTSGNTALATISGNIVTVVGANSLQSVSITASQSGDLTHSAAPSVVRSLQILPKPVTVTANVQTKVFGDTEPALATPAISPVLVGTDLATGILLRAPGENVGSYEIQQNTFALDPYKYAMTYVPANFTISKKQVTITPKLAYSKTYGATEPVLEFNFTPLVSPDVLSGTIARIPGEDAGTYNFDLGTITASTNYNLVLSPSPQFTINKSVITVTPITASIQYGDAEPTLGYNHVPALKTGDAFTGTLERAPGNMPNTYLINQGTLALSSNYTLNFSAVPANFTVLKKNISITPTAGQGKVYGEVDGTINYVSSPALLDGDTFSGALGRAAGSAVNNYSIGIGSLVASNPQKYNLQLATENYAITKKPIMVTATPVSQAFGVADPISLPYTLSTPLETGDAFAGKLSRTPGTDIGSYPIDQGNLSLSTNYDLSFSPADLTITAKGIVITAVSNAKTYGDNDPEFDYTSSATLIGGDVFTGKLGRATGEEVGSYALSLGNLKVNNNYSLTLNPGTSLTINKKEINVIAQAQTKVYGSNDPSLTYNSNPTLVVGDSFSGALSRVAGNHVGTYAIEQGDLTLSSNYTLNYTPANLAITAKSIAVQITAGGKTYGAAEPQLNYTSIPLLESGDVFTGAISRAPGENKGTYLISKGTLAASTDYSVTFNNANFVIDPAPLTITANPKTKFVGTANPVFDGQYSGFVNGETKSVLTSPATFTSAATINSQIGTYPIVTSGAVAANYTITQINGVLTVVAGAPTAVLFAGTTLYENQAAGSRAGTLSSTSDDPNATFTYSLVNGNGDTDNASFRINGDQLLTTASLNYEDKKVYSVKVRSTTQHNFSLDKTITINLSDVNEIPTLDAIANKTICYTTTGQTIDLTGISAGPDAGQNTMVTVTGSNAALLQSLTVGSGGSTGTISYRVKNGASGTSTITVTVKDNGGTDNGGIDTYSRTFVLTVNALPVITINANKGINNNSNSTTISKGESVGLTAVGGTSYAWALDNSIVSGQATANLVVRPRETTTYTVTVTNANGCSEQKSFTVNVLDDLVTIRATNILTPNGDGYNDKWVIDNIDFYPNNEVKVFDKSGRMVYGKKSYDNSWDGMLNGMPLAEGTYYYVIDFGKDRPRFKGFITIVRQN
ncbi:MBG domain-containing protein [Pedobacter gandavensis]|uniref:MBG domain-containing protein n=1 Tax=Pedobacter gandavensis TaxID=2679963 RepID=UPI002930395E|nr:MBG domain-containing protein [Pedobacter gandavensis]